MKYWWLIALGYLLRPFGRTPVLCTGYNRVEKGDGWQHLVPDGQCVRLKIERLR